MWFFFLDFLLNLSSLQFKLKVYSSYKGNKINKWTIIWCDKRYPYCN